MIHLLLLQYNLANPVLSRAEPLQDLYYLQTVGGITVPGCCQTTASATWVTWTWTLSVCVKYEKQTQNMQKINILFVACT